MHISHHYDHSLKSSVTTYSCTVEISRPSNDRHLVPSDEDGSVVWYKEDTSHFIPAVVRVENNGRPVPFPSDVVFSTKLVYADQSIGQCSEAPTNVLKQSKNKRKKKDGTKLLNVVYDENHESHKLIGFRIMEVSSTHGGKKFQLEVSATSPSLGPIASCRSDSIQVGSKPPKVKSKPNAQAPFIDAAVRGSEDEQDNEAHGRESTNNIREEPLRDIENNCVNGVNGTPSNLLAPTEDPPEDQLEKDESEFPESVGLSEGDVSSAPESAGLSESDLSSALPSTGTSTTLLAGLPMMNIDKHALFLVQLRGRAILLPLMNHKYGYVFNDPVDPEALRIPDYFNVIERPMDFGTIMAGLNDLKYQTIEEVDAAIRLTLSNALRYNPEGNPVHKMTLALKAIHEEISSSASTCSLCGAGELKLRMPTVFCDGPSCSLTDKLIVGHNTPFYEYDDGDLCLCTLCYRDAGEEIDLPGGNAVKKTDLKKTTAAQSAEVEPSVDCQSCGKWFHQACGLVRSTGPKVGATYICPPCFRAQSSLLSLPSVKMSAKDLPETVLSRFIQDKVHQIPKAEAIVIRQATSNVVTDQTDKNILEVCPAFPASCSFRSKCILAFQSIGGIDVMLFGMYVHEYANGMIYLSYLDSLQYMDPGEIRTSVYHEIIMACFAYAATKGATCTTAHIWSCAPPGRHEDYLFLVKPAFQKLLDDKRLLHWYKVLLKEMQKRGIASSVTTYFDRYLAKTNVIDSSTIMTGDVVSVEASIILATNPSISSGKFSDLLTKSLRRSKKHRIVIDLNPDLAEEEIRVAENLIDDDASEFDSDIFHDRNKFIKYCEKNGYQFDELRRAMQGSLAVLRHLHEQHPFRQSR